MARDSVGELRFDYMDEAYVCRPQGDAFANADLRLHHTVKNSVRFPLVRLHDVKRVFFPGLKAWLTNYRGVWGKGCCPFSLVDCHIILVSQVVTPQVSVGHSRAGNPAAMFLQHPQCCGMSMNDVLYYTMSCSYNYVRCIT